MHAPMDMVVSIIVAIFGSTGIWSLIQYKIEQKSASRQMILGLGYYELVHACDDYLERGWIELGEFEDLNKYLYMPYKAMGGNGTAEAMMEKVKKLPNKPPERE